MWAESREGSEAGRVRVLQSAGVTGSPRRPTRGRPLLEGRAWRGEGQARTVPLAGLQCLGLPAVIQQQRGPGAPTRAPRDLPRARPRPCPPPPRAQGERWGRGRQLRVDPHPDPHQPPSPSSPIVSEGWDPETPRLLHTLGHSFLYSHDKHVLNTFSVPSTLPGPGGQWGTDWSSPCPGGADLLAGLGSGEQSEGIDKQIGNVSGEEVTVPRRGDRVGGRGVAASWREGVPDTPAASEVQLLLHSGPHPVPTHVCQASRPGVLALHAGQWAEGPWCVQGQSSRQHRRGTRVGLPPPGAGGLARLDHSWPSSSCALESGWTRTALPLTLSALHGGHGPTTCRLLGPGRRPHTRVQPTHCSHRRPRSTRPGRRA